jgi:Rne/Rng family ribonuclease
MSKELVISASSHERRVAILEEGQLVEIYIEREKEFALVGSIYKGKVTRVLPGMQSAFVDIGLDGDAFLYVSDVFENLEDYDHGHDHAHVSGDAPLPAIAGGNAPSTIELLPGESLATSGVHDDLHLDETQADHAPVDDAPQDEYRAAEFREREEAAAAAAAEQHQDSEVSDADERQPESNASAPQNFAPSYNPTRSYPPRGGSDRGPDRGGDRGDRAGDRGGDRGRGRRGRWGRRRPGGGGGGGGHHHGQGGRNLPPSKYASPQGERDSRSYDNRRPNDRVPSAPVDKVEDDIVLPGESLAKYRGRPVPPPVEPVREQEPEERQPDFEQPTGRTAVGLPQGGPGVRRRFSGSLPHWVLADAKSEAAEATPSEEVAASASSEAVEPISAPIGEHPQEAAAAQPAHNGSSLDEEQLAALSASLVEAKHEETQARAEADTLVGGATFDEEEEEVHEADEHLHDEEDHEDAEHEESERAREDAEDEADREHQEAIEASEADLHAEHDSEQEPGRESEHESEHDSEQHSGHGSEEFTTRVGSESYASLSAQGKTTESIIEEDVVLLPGETRTPRDPNAPREEFVRRDSARIGSNPRSRFQRPQRGGRDRGGDRGGRGRFDRPRGRDRGGDRGPDRGPDGGRGRFERRGGPGHSHGPHRGHQGGHAPVRRPQLISEMLKPGQDVVVQIAKEPLGKKGARITSHVALPGRFLVYMPTIDHIGVSRKIASADNRSRLRRLVGEARGSYPGGFIVRTAAGGATDDEIRTDIEFLGKTWNEIKEKSEDRKPPALLHRDLNLVERILRDYVSDDFTAIWIDSEEEYGKVVEFVSRFQPRLVNRVKLYTKEQPIFEEFGIQHELDKALRAKVWLKSGGYIVINHTEALVAIDVNTGKFVGKGSTRLEDTIVKTNLEAVKEIVRQIRLRDLGGIIVVDFIDMEERRNREKVLAALQFALEQDKAPSKALSFNEFGLVCITRKRTKQALERVLCQPCPYCTGSGMVKSIPTLCYEIQSEARKMAVTPEHEGPNLTLRVHPEIAKALKTRESMLIDELEQNAHKHIIIQSDPTLHWEQYDIY